MASVTRLTTREGATCRNPAVVDEDFIWLSRWETFQHYKPDPERGPKWIKTHTAQLADSRYLDLTDRQRALLHDLRMMFATFRGRVPCDAPMIARHRGRHTRDVDLDSLNHAGLVEFVSRATLERRLEQLYSRSRAEVEVEKEKELRASKPLAADVFSAHSDGADTTCDGDNGNGHPHASTGSNGTALDLSEIGRAVEASLAEAKRRGAA